MIVIPAIDLLNNQAVRLYKGDYAQKTIYSNSPWELVRSFQLDGAELLHLVDLNGARNEPNVNQTSIQKIRESTKMQIEIGGGIRSLDKIKFYDSLGINRFILGTAAVTDPKFLDLALETYSADRIVVGVDAKDGIVSINGWEENTKLSYIDFLKKLESKGVKHIVFTDISLDGTLAGPNIDSYKKILSLFNFHLIASGGVSSVEDVIELSTIHETKNLFGVITGKAIYENKLNLKQAVISLNCKK